MRADPVGQTGPMSDDYDGDRPWAPDEDELSGAGPGRAAEIDRAVPPEAPEADLIEQELVVPLDEEDDQPQ